MGRAIRGVNMRILVSSVLIRCGEDFADDLAWVMDGETLFR